MLEAWANGSDSQRAEYAAKALELERFCPGYSETHHVLDVDGVDGCDRPRFKASISKLPLCPHSQHARSTRWGSAFKAVDDSGKIKNKKFNTFNPPNVPDLTPDTIRDLFKVSARLWRQPVYEPASGVLEAFEVTHKKQAGTFNAHLHQFLDAGYIPSYPMDDLEVSHYRDEDRQVCTDCRDPNGPCRQGKPVTHYIRDAGAGNIKKDGLVVLRSFKGYRTQPCGIRIPTRAECPACYAALNTYKREGDPASAVPGPPASLESGRTHYWACSLPKLSVRRSWPGLARAFTAECQKTGTYKASCGTSSGSRIGCDHPAGDCELFDLDNPNHWYFVDQRQADAGAVVEATKYVTKSSDLIDTENSDAAWKFLQAIKGIRLIRYRGTFYNYFEINGKTGDATLIQRCDALVDVVDKHGNQYQRPCGVKNPAIASFCKKCGSQLPDWIDYYESLMAEDESGEAVTDEYSALKPIEKVAPTDPDACPYPDCPDPGGGTYSGFRVIEPELLTKRRERLRYSKSTGYYFITGGEP